MNQAYSQELREDTARIAIPVITITTMLFCLLATIVSTDFRQVWHFWAIVAAAPIVGKLSWEWLKNTPIWGITFFLISYLTFITLLVAREWEPGSPIPYLFAIFIVASSLFHHPRTGFIIWSASSILMILGVSINVGSISLMVFEAIQWPLLINFFMVVIAYLSALEWQVAVETVSDLHRNVQRRRDELFAMQEEVSMTNARLRFANEQLEKARQAAITERDLRTRFMHHVSHELRTPLNSIVNFAHILSQGGRGPVDPAQADYLVRIEQSGWHLLSVLNDLLDMAQIQAGEFKLQMETAELKSICEEAVTSVRGLLLDQPVELIRDYPAEWPLVHIDKMRLKQSLINLLGNAVKYTEAGYIALRVHPDDQFVHIKVEDTGIGIAPEHYETIFQEFRQLNETAARRRHGTGLGLPITRHLVELHGGSLTVDSVLGEGSIFTISLPIVTPDTPTPTDDPAEGASTDQVIDPVSSSA